MFFKFLGVGLDAAILLLCGAAGVTLAQNRSRSPNLLRREPSKVHDQALNHGRDVLKALDNNTEKQGFV